MITWVPLKASTNPITIEAVPLLPCKAALLCQGLAGVFVGNFAIACWAVEIGVGQDLNVLEVWVDCWHWRWWWFPVHGDVQLGVRVSRLHLERGIC